MGEVVQSSSRRVATAMLTVLSIPVSEASRRKRPTCRLPGEPAASGEHGADDRGRWLTVAGDVAEGFSQVERALALLSARFAKAIWALGNLELWTMPNDEAQLRGEAGCQKLVDVYRAPGVATLEDAYPTWQTATGPVVVAPTPTTSNCEEKRKETTRNDAISATSRNGQLLPGTSSIFRWGPPRQVA